MAGKRRVVLTRFSGGGIMPYLTDEKYTIGDLAVIETNKKKLVVVKVCQTNDIPEKIRKRAIKWLVQKVDMTNYRSKQTDR
jgi:hypothetical protein